MTRNDHLVQMAGLLHCGLEGLHGEGDDILDVNKALLAKGGGISHHLHADAVTSASALETSTYCIVFMLRRSTTETIFLLTSGTPLHTSTYQHGVTHSSILKSTIR